MKIYYAIDITGLLDLRRVKGAFEIKKYAIEAAKRMILEDLLSAPHGGTKRGHWYAVHPFGGFTDGPYPTKAKANRERLRNAREMAQDVNYDLGFVARVIHIFGDSVPVAVVEREYPSAKMISPWIRAA